ncbi:hypothetical protein BESB_014930 [Besnoitia besnoiti]|uniref:BRCT domain-containing protein n=1 Tax=Besnoitia besnoiti TaxID=94643 RepID=A0A2A9MBV1_BESBE|nr:hypothetical protein BESB_014930 [Besnoitia besnoiti]PFH32880.1 hypothetical protein BESB_014930 [Besnoitia besnoiti]
MELKRRVPVAHESRDAWHSRNARSTPNAVSLFSGRQFCLLGFDRASVCADASLVLAAEAWESCADAAARLSAPSSGSSGAREAQDGGEGRRRRDTLSFCAARPQKAQRRAPCRRSEARRGETRAAQPGARAASVTPASWRRSPRLRENSKRPLRKSFKSHPLVLPASLWRYRHRGRHGGSVIRASPSLSRSARRGDRRENGTKAVEEEAAGDKDDEESGAPCTDPSAESVFASLEAEKTLRDLATADFVILNFGAGFTALRRLADVRQRQRRERGDSEKRRESLQGEDASAVSLSSSTSPPFFSAASSFSVSAALGGLRRLGEAGESAAEALAGGCSGRVSLALPCFLDRRRLLSPLWLLSCVADGFLYWPAYSPFFSVSAFLHPALPPLRARPPWRAAVGAAEAVGGDAEGLPRVFLLGAARRKRRLRLAREWERGLGGARGGATPRSLSPASDAEGEGEEGGDGYAWLQRFGLLDGRNLEEEEELSTARRKGATDPEVEGRTRDAKVLSRTDFGLFALALRVCGAAAVTEGEIEALGAQREEATEKNDADASPLPATHVVVCSPRALERCLRPRSPPSGGSPVSRFNRGAPERRHRAGADDGAYPSGSRDASAVQGRGEEEDRRRREKRRRLLLAGLGVLQENQVPFLSLQWLLDLYASGVLPSSRPYLLQLPSLAAVARLSAASRPSTVGAAVSVSARGWKDACAERSENGVLREFSVLLSVYVAVESPGLVEKCKAMGAVSVVVVPPLFPLCASLTVDALADADAPLPAASQVSEVSASSQNTPASRAPPAGVHSVRRAQRGRRADEETEKGAGSERRADRRRAGRERRGGARERRRAPTQEEREGNAEEGKTKLLSACRPLLQGLESFFHAEDLDEAVHDLAAASDGPRPLLIVSDAEVHAGLVGYAAFALECFYAHVSAATPTGRGGASTALSPSPRSTPDSLFARVKREPQEEAAKEAARAFQPWGVAAPPLLADLRVPAQARRCVGACGSRLHRQAEAGRESLDDREDRETLLLATPEWLQSCWERQRLAPLHGFALQSLFPPHLLSGFVEELAQEDLHSSQKFAAHGGEEAEREEHRRLLDALEADVVIVARGDSQDRRVQRRKILKENQEKRVPSMVCPRREEAMRCHELYMEAGRRWKSLSAQERDRKEGD